MEDGGGSRESGGSLYLRIMLVLATVLVSAANLPVGAKLGFCFSGSAEGSSFAVESGLPLKASFWDGRGALDRLEGGRDLWGDLERERVETCLRAARWWLEYSRSS